MSRHYKEHTKPNKFKKNREWGLIDYIQLLIVISPFLYIFIDISTTVVGLNLLKHQGKITKGVVTKYYDSGLHIGTPCYKYNFYYKGESYYGHTSIKIKYKDRIGDSIDIVYLDYWPSMSRPTYYFK